MAEKTTKTIHYRTHGDSANFVESIQNEIEAAQSTIGPEDRDAREYRFTLTGRYGFGYQLDARFTSDGICKHYKARKTGYKGEFTMEGRGPTPEVLDLLERFFRPWNPAGTPTRGELEDGGA